MFDTEMTPKTIIQNLPPRDFGGKNISAKVDRFRIKQEDERILEIRYVRIDIGFGIPIFFN